MLLDVSCPARGSARRKTQPALAVVANDDPFAEIHAELRAAFADVAACRQALAGAEQRAVRARAEYARQHGLAALPRLELLQTRFGPKPTPRANTSESAQ